MRLKLTYDQLVTLMNLLVKLDNCRFDNTAVKQFSIAILRPFAAKLIRLRFPVRPKISMQLSVAECLALTHMLKTVPAESPDELGFLAEFQQPIHQTCLQNF